MRAGGRRVDRAEDGGLGLAFPALLVGSLLAMGLFAHLAYGASLLRGLVGIATTAAILVFVVAVAQLAGAAAERRRR